MSMSSATAMSQNELSLVVCPFAFSSGKNCMTRSILLLLFFIIIIVFKFSFVSKLFIVENRFYSQPMVLLTGFKNGKVVSFSKDSLGRR